MSRRLAGHQVAAIVEKEECNVFSDAGKSWYKGLNVTCREINAD